MRASFVSILLTLTVHATSLPTSHRHTCNPCGTISRMFNHDPLMHQRGTVNFGMTKNKLSLGLGKLHAQLKSVYREQSQPLTESFVTLEESYKQHDCGIPNVVGIKNWIVCVYNTISSALKNITEKEIYSPTLNTADIVIITREVLCNFKLVLIQIDENHNKLQNRLSVNACATSRSQRVITPSSNLYLETLQSLSVAMNVVQNVNSTLSRTVSGRSLRHRNNCRRNTRRKSNKNKKSKKGKNTTENHQKRNKNVRNRKNKKNRKICNKNKNRQNKNNILTNRS